MNVWDWEKNKKGQMTVWRNEQLEKQTLFYRQAIIHQAPNLLLLSPTHQTFGAKLFFFRLWKLRSRIALLCFFFIFLEEFLSRIFESSVGQKPFCEKVLSLFFFLLSYLSSFWLRHFFWVQNNNNNNARQDVSDIRILLRCHAMTRCNIQDVK
jgi:hypothetical protein